MQRRRRPAKSTSTRSGQRSDMPPPKDYPKRVRISKKFPDMDVTPEEIPSLNDPAGHFAFVRYDDGYTAKIFRSSDLLRKDDAPVHELAALQPGEVVLAKWSDGKFYKASIEYISSGGPDQGTRRKEVRKKNAAAADQFYISQQQDASIETPVYLDLDKQGAENQVSPPLHSSGESFCNLIASNNLNLSSSSSSDDTVIIARSPITEHGEVCFPPQNNCNYNENLLSHTFPQSIYAPDSCSLPRGQTAIHGHVTSPQLHNTVPPFQTTGLPYQTTSLPCQEQTGRLSYQIATMPLFRQPSGLPLQTTIPPLHREKPTPFWQGQTSGPSLQTSSQPRLGEATTPLHQAQTSGQPLLTTVASSNGQTTSRPSSAAPQWELCDACKEEVEKILQAKRKVDEVISRIDPEQLHQLQTLIEIVGEHQQKPTFCAQAGHQELFPGSGLYVSSFRLAAMQHAAKKDCLRLFHQLFDHFFTIEECQNAVAFGRHGKTPEGKQKLDHQRVDGILTYVLRCGSLEGWTSVEKLKLKKAFINKCRLRAAQK